MKLYSYNKYSNSAKSLAQGLGIRRIKHEGSRYRPRASDKLINWGSSNLPDNLMVMEIINHPENVRRMSNKLTYHEALTNSLGENDQKYLLEWTTNKAVALQWLLNGQRAAVRGVLTGHSANGLEILEPSENASIGDVPDAPLYTKYFKKREEYRVHVINGQVIDVQRKGRKRDVPDDQVNWKVRNLANGFIYMRENIELPQEVQNAVNTIHPLTGLDFGAYDVLYNQSQNSAKVIEVNTAPGLTGTTLENYINAFEAVKGE